MARNKSLPDKLAFFFHHSSLKRSLNTVGSLLGGKADLALAPAKPWMLQVEVTNRCNINCWFCSRNTAQLQLGDLSAALQDKVVELSSYAHLVALFGYGEPLVSRAFYALLPRLRSSSFMFFTNGMLLDARQMSRILESAARPLSGVVYSVDGACKETYETIRKGSNFDQVWRNIREVSALRSKNGLDFEIRLEFVAMTSNVAELPRVVEMAADAGLDGVKVSHLVVWREDMRHLSLLYDPALCGQAFAQARAAAERCGVWLDLPKDFSKTLHSQPGPTPPCRQPWQYAMISYEGDVRACCFAPALTMGNLNRSSFNEIWNSKPYRALRSRINTPSTPGVCLRCEERFREAASPDETATYIKLKPRAK